MNRQEAIKEITKRLVKKRGYWPQADFIRHNKLDISQATLSRWESGEFVPPVHALVNLGIIQFK